MTDGDSGLPENPDPNTLRAVVILMQRDIRRLERSIDENGRLDDDDRLRLGRLEDRADHLLRIMDRTIVGQIKDFFSHLFGLGDNSRRPWVWVVTVALFAGGALLTFGRSTYYGAEAREERIEQVRRAARVDSVERSRRYELDRLRLEREIADDRADEAEARLDRPLSPERDTVANVPSPL